MYFEDRVHKFEYKLNDTDDQIIEFIMNNKKEMVHISIQALAAQLFTVPNTLTRLSKKLGYDGYSHLKNSIKEELQSDDTLEKDELHQNIQRTLSLLDPDKLAITVKMIQDAERVLFFGVGDSMPFCEMMVKNLKIAGKLTEFHAHRHDIMHEINHLKKDALLFFISLSGETPQVLELAKLCKEKQLRSISLTHFSRNSLQSLADVNLFCYSPRQTIDGYNITDKTPLMIIIRALSLHYWQLIK